MVEPADVPDAVWLSAGVDPVGVAHVDVVPFHDGTGAASGRVELITAELPGTVAQRLIRKTFEPLHTGPHAAGSQSPDHWSYWRRELIAYPSGILPQGPALRAPRLFGVADDALYIEYVGERPATTEEAASSVGRWHRRDHTPNQPWLANDQLAQRIAVTRLDWSAVEVDRRLPALWDQRHDWLSQVDALPRCITHGDFSTGNLRVDRSGVIALDWATLGLSPVGFDLAHLALATQDESLLPIYLDGLTGRFRAADVELGYRITVCLVGASRAHWMVSRSLPLPAGYTDFICAHQP